MKKLVVVMSLVVGSAVQAGPSMIYKALERGTGIEFESEQHYIHRLEMLYMWFLAEIGRLQTLAKPHIAVLLFGEIQRFVREAMKTYKYPWAAAAVVEIEQALPSKTAAGAKKLLSRDPKEREEILLQDWNFIMQFYPKLFELVKFFEADKKIFFVGAMDPKYLKLIQ